MTPTRRTHLLLWSTAALGAIGAALVVASAKLWPVSMPPQSVVSVAAARAGGAEGTTAPALATFEPIFRKDLRRPLVDPMPSAPVAVATAKPAAVPGVRLVGTVVEANHSYGIFATGLSTIEVRGVGQKLSSGAEVLEIAAKSARVRHSGRTISLPLTDPTTSPGGKGPLTTADILQRMRERSAAAASGNTEPAPEPAPRRARRQPKQASDDEDADAPKDEEMGEPEIFDPAVDPS